MSIEDPALSQAENLFAATNAKWAAEIAKLKIEHTEMLQRVGMLRQLLEIDGLIIVPLEGIGPNTVVVSQQTYDDLKTIVKCPYMMQPEEFVRLRMLKRSQM